MRVARGPGGRAPAGSRDSAPRRTARPKDVCATRSGGPGDDQELSRHFPAERIQALLIKTNKIKKTGFKVQCVAGQPLHARSGAALVFFFFSFMNWQCVCVYILINRENQSPIYVIWGPPSLLEGVRKKSSAGKQSILLVLGVNDYCQR